MPEQTITFEAEAPVFGTLNLPDGASRTMPVPAVVLLGGTRDSSELSVCSSGFVNLRQQQLLGTIARRLAHNGIASLRLQKWSGACGRGGGRPGYDTDVAGGVAAFRWLQRCPEIDATRIGLIGHSAGALTACLVCRDVREVACVGLLAALYGPIEEFLRWNWKRIARHWYEFTAEQRRWLKQKWPAEVVGAFCVEAIIEAARRGTEVISLEAQGVRVEVQTVRIQQEMEEPAAAAFPYVKGPVLLLHGSDDMDIDVEDSFRACRALLDAGNKQMGLLITPGADHYFQPVDANRLSRVWERVDLDQVHRPVSALALEGLAAWTAQALGAGGSDGSSLACSVKRPGLFAQSQTMGAKMGAPYSAPPS